MTSKKVTRKWEIFAGRNKFLCDGRLMTAPHNGIFYVTVFLIIATSILFFVFDCPYLADRITPAIPCIGATLFIFTMGSLLRTSFSDPGIIPRAAQDEASYIEKQIEVPNSCNSPTLRPPPRTKEVLVRGQPVKLKYCYTCKIFRPPRASHCSLCDNCVDRFDHHCPWVGNCVGKRNYRFFYMFILSLAFLAVFIFSCAITHLVLLVRDPPGSAILDALRISPASAIVSAICFLSVWSVLGMAGFHTYLITTDQTTNEDIKGSFSTKRGQESPNPYSRGGVCSNCWHVLCGPMTPSLIDRRGVVTNELRMEFESRVNKRDSSPPIIVLPPYPTIEDVSAVYNTAEPTGPLSGSYTNLYRLNEMDSDQEDACECESINDKPIDLPANIPNGVGDVENKESHLYSNLAHSSYMNNNLDLDPVVLTGSKENLMSAKESRQQRTEMKHKVPALKFPAEQSCQNVVYKRKKDAAVINDELNRNTIKPLQIKIEPGNVNANVQHQTWADKPTRNGNNNNDIAFLSASKLKLLHDTTMIDTALDLDSLDEVGDPIGTYNRPRTSSYSNMYKLNEKNADVKSAGTIKSITMNLEPNIPNGTLNMESKEGHLYSNVGHLSYMNHNLDLDPVVLSDSKENLMSSKDVSHQRIEKMHKVPTVKFSTESSFQNVAYRREKDSTISSDELNHNTIRPLPMKIDSSDLKTNNQKQTWADRLPRNENCNIDISVLSASKLKMSHDNTMIDTALDLDSLDGSTVSLWPATV